MASLRDAQLKKMVEELETGMNCYLHRQTDEVITYPDPDQFLDTDHWHQGIKEIENLFQRLPGNYSDE